MSCRWYSRILPSIRISGFCWHVRDTVSDQISNIDILSLAVVIQQSTVLQNLRSKVANIFECNVRTPLTQCTNASSPNQGLSGSR